MVAFLIVLGVAVSGEHPQGQCLDTLAATCPRVHSLGDCLACGSRTDACLGTDLHTMCREHLASQAPDPQDPPFDLSKVQFSGTFTDHAVLQRGPRRASVFGTATLGAAVTVTLRGPNGSVCFFFALATPACAGSAAFHKYLGVCCVWWCVDTRANGEFDLFSVLG